jgi:hypothetical protein
MERFALDEINWFVKKSPGSLVFIQSEGTNRVTSVSIKVG